MTNLIETPQKMNPQIYARLAGLAGLMIVASAVFVEGLVRGNLIVSGDSAATSANIMQSADLFRLGLAADLITLCFDIAYTLLLYVLLRPAGLNLVRLATLFRVVTISILGVITFFHLGALLVLDGAPYLNAFSDEQRQALSLFSLKLHSNGYNIALVFFAVHVCLLATLVIKSGYLPKFVGFMLLGAAGCYAINSFANILNLGFADDLFPLILLLPLLAETSLTLWLLIAGVKQSAWDASP